MQRNATTLPQPGMSKPIKDKEAQSKHHNKHHRSSSRSEAAPQPPVNHNQVSVTAEEPVAKSKQSELTMLPKNEYQTFQTDFREFTENHRIQLKSMAKMLKRVQRETYSVQLLLIERNETLKAIEEKIAAKEEQIELQRAEHKKSLDEKIELSLKYDQFEVKYSALETLYEKAVQTMRSEMEHLKQTNKSRILEQNKLIESYEAKYKHGQNALSTMSDELDKKSERIKEVEQTVEQQNEELSKLQAALEIAKLELEENREQRIVEYEAQIATLSLEAHQFEESYEKCRQEKDELEAAKNKIIDEQAFKIREIERFLVQPTNRVQPNAATAQNEQIAVAVPPLRHSEVQILSVPEEHQDEPEEVNSTRAALRRRITRGFNRFAFDLDSENGDGDNEVVDVYERFKPLLPPTLQRKRIRECDEASLGSQGSDIFDRLKRQKNN